jgi:hypothetical protein
MGEKNRENTNRKEMDLLLFFFFLFLLFFLLLSLSQVSGQGGADNE